MSVQPVKMFLQSRQTFFFNVLLLYFFIIIKCQNPFSSCWDGDSGCTRCIPGRNQSFTLTFLHYDNYQENLYFLNKTKEAQDLMTKTDSRNILSFDLGPVIHTTFICTFFNLTNLDFCCHSSEERTKIIQILKELKWRPMRLTYDKTWCNIDQKGTIIYIHSQPTQESQRILHEFYTNVAQELKKNDIIIQRRIQSFHSTQARVNRNFPTDQVTKILNQTVIYGQVYIDKMYLGFNIFYATKPL